MPTTSTKTIGRSHRIGSVGTWCHLLRRVGICVQHPLAGLGNNNRLCPGAGGNLVPFKLFDSLTQPAFAVASPSPRGVLRFPCTSSRSLQAGPRFRNFSHQNFTNTYMSHRSTETDPDARTYKYLRQRAVDAQLFVRIRDAPHSVVESSNQEIKEAAMYCRQAGGCTEQAQMAVSDCLVSLMTLMGKDQSGHLVDAVRLWGTDEHFKSAEMVLGHEGVVIVQKAGAEVDTFKDAFTYNQDPVPGAQREETRAQQTFAMPRVASVCHPDLGK
ncbi:hypothetical protein EV363DRAFT_1418619 [Boletus edulis]|nr:hypothetical protein EV363DRAFT_1418619 [Boletus edulis]